VWGSWEPDADRIRGESVEIACFPEPEIEATRGRWWADSTIDDDARTEGSLGRKAVSLNL
jgi:hypothetical protein